MFGDVLADDANMTSSADQQLPQQLDQMSVVAEDGNTTCKADEPSVQCLAADLLSTWHTLKVSTAGICLLFLSTTLVLARLK